MSSSGTPVMSCTPVGPLAEMFESRTVGLVVVGFRYVAMVNQIPVMSRRVRGVSCSRCEAGCRG